MNQPDDRRILNIPLRFRQAELEVIRSSGQSPLTWLQSVVRAAVDAERQRQANAPREGTDS